MATMASISVKLAMLGDVCTGKSRLLQTIIGSGSNASPTSVTTGMECVSGSVVAEGGRRISIQGWDTGGQERFHSNTIVRSYYRGVSLFIIVFDVTLQSSFKHVQSWKEIADSHADHPFEVVVVGNKIDCPNRVVRTEEGQRFAEDKGYTYIETSCVTGENIEELKKLIGSISIEKLVRNDGGVAKRDALSLEGNDDEEDEMSKCAC